jgi:hypothetical protein
MLGKIQVIFLTGKLKYKVHRLIERVHLVTAVKTTRMKTAQYKFHILLLCPYIIIFALMVKEKDKMNRIVETYMRLKVEL